MKQLSKSGAVLAECFADLAGQNLHPAVSIDRFSLSFCLLPPDASVQRVWLARPCWSEQ